MLLEKRSYHPLLSHRLLMTRSNIDPFFPWLQIYLICVMYHMLLQVLACSPHDGVFMECVDIKIIESEFVQLLKGSAIHCRQLENNFQNGQVVVYC